MHSVLRSLCDAAVSSTEPSNGQTVPSPRLLSSLAEGTDQLVAKTAIDLGFELVVPLPLPEEEYLRDFETAASQDEFRSLLARAGHVLPPRWKPERPEAYRAAGKFVLENCNVLITIFDGGVSAGIGGTAEMIDLARNSGLPTICIDAAVPHGIAFAGTPEPLDAIRNLSRTLVQARDGHAIRNGAEVVL